MRHHIHFNTHAPIAATTSSSSAGSSSSAASPIDIDNLFAVIVSLLNDATTDAAKSAIVKTKELSKNADAQLQLNQKQANEHLTAVPTIKKQRYTVSKGHWTAGPPGASIIWVSSKVYSWRTSIGNQNQINLAEIHNKGILDERNTATNQMMLLQQQAQTMDSSINQTFQNAMQSQQEGSSALQLLQTITFKALMRQEPN